MNFITNGNTRGGEVGRRAFHYRVRVNLTPLIQTTVIRGLSEYEQRQGGWGVLFCFEENHDELTLIENRKTFGKPSHFPIPLVVSFQRRIGICVRTMDVGALLSRT